MASTAQRIILENLEYQPNSDGVGYKRISWFFPFFRPTEAWGFILYWTVIIKRSAAPQTALWEGPGPVFEPGKGCPEWGTKTPPHLLKTGNLVGLEDVHPALALLGPEDILVTAQVDVLLTFQVDSAAREHRLKIPKHNSRDTTSVADSHLLLCGCGSGSQKMSIWIRILGGKD